jgi:hypothetical protein
MHMHGEMTILGSIAVHLARSGALALGLLLRLAR